MQQINKTKLVEIFTDGACKGNPGIGGWGVYLHVGEDTLELFGGEKLLSALCSLLKPFLRSVWVTRCRSTRTPSTYKKESVSGFMAGKSADG